MKKILLLTGIIALTIFWDTKLSAQIVVQAETGVLSGGVTVATSQTGYTGTGYVTNFTTTASQVVMTFQVTTTGLYDFIVRYSSSSGNKGFDFKINSTSGSGTFPQSNSFTTVNAGKVYLQAGQNTVTIIDGWGYYSVDNVTFSPTVVTPPVKPPKTLVNANSTCATKALFSFLVDQYGTKMLSGQQDLADAQYVQSITGKYPAIGSFDFIEYSPTRVANGSNPTGTSEKYITWSQMGNSRGITSLMWHWNAPTDLYNTAAEPWWKGFYTEATSFDLQAALADPNSTRYKLLISDMDVIAGELKKFRDANIPVLWRPLHEASGGWFWWGAKGAGPFKQLWQIMYDRFTNYHGLNNLIWVYTSDVETNWYPGDAYVDIVSMDQYQPEGSSLSSAWDGIYKLYGSKKLITLSESGSMPVPDLVRTYGTWWSWFSIWSGTYIRDKSTSLVQQVYNDVDVLTMDELPDWKTCTGNTPPVVSLTSPDNNANFCSGISITLTATASDADGPISKVEFFDGANLLATVTSSPYTYNWTNAGTASHTITAKATDNGGAATSSSIVSIVVNAKPSAPTVATPVNYCQNSTVSALTATGSALKWYTVSAGGTASGSAPVPVTSTTGTVNYYVSQTINGCESARATLAVIINPIPSAPAVATPVIYCQNSTASSLTATGSALKWYTVSTGGTASGTAPVPVTTTTGTVNYYVSQTTNGCESGRATLAVTINPIPSSPTVSTPVNYCQNSTASSLIATGSGLKWYTVSTGGIGSATAPAPLTTSTGTFSYYVSQTANSCESSRAMIAVIVNAIPSAPSVAAQITYCQNSTASSLTATGSGLKWYTEPNGGTASSVAPVPSTSNVGVTDYYVTQAINGCESLRSMITVTINSAATATITANGPSTFCQGGSVILAANTGSSYAWFNGNMQVGTASTYTASIEGSYTVQVFNPTGCQGQITSLATDVIVNPLPLAAITVGGPTTFIQGGNVVLSANTGVDLSYKWFNGTTEVGSGATYLATVSGDYTVKVSNAWACEAISNIVNVTVNANQPSVIIITSPANSTNVTGPSVTINVTATDSDGSIILVEYLDGNTVIGSSTNQPYTYTWNNPSTGTHDITVRVTDSNGGITTSSPSSVNVQTATGIFTSPGMDAFSKIYPNPTNERIHIETNIHLANASIKFLDGLGAEVMVPVTKDGTDAYAELSDLASGVYSILITEGDFIIRQKVIVIH